MASSSARFACFMETPSIEPEVSITNVTSRGMRTVRAALPVGGKRVTRAYVPSGPFSVVMELCGCTPGAGFQDTSKSRSVGTISSESRAWKEWLERASTTRGCVSLARDATSKPALRFSSIETGLRFTVAGRKGGWSNSSPSSRRQCSRSSPVPVSSSPSNSRSGSWSSAGLPLVNRASEVSIPGMYRGVMVRGNRSPTRPAASSSVCWYSISTSSSSSGPRFATRLAKRFGRCCSTRVARFPSAAAL